MTAGYNRPFDVALIDDFALTAERTAGLGILDVSDPLAPVRIGNFKRPGSFASSVVFRGRTAFVGNENAGLVILDVNVPENPVILGSATPPTKANGLGLDGNRALVATAPETEIIDPQAPAGIRFYRIELRLPQ